MNLFLLVPEMIYFVSSGAAVIHGAIVGVGPVTADKTSTDDRPGATG